MAASPYRVAPAVLALAVAATAALAESPGESDADDPGARDYRRYCASCHGVLADGDGPVAPALRTPPADLTRLGERYGMPLPRNKLLPFIDGRDARRAHGSREMPVWGRVLHEELGGAREREMMLRGTLHGILDHLESLQAAAPSAAP